MPRLATRQTTPPTAGPARGNGTQVTDDGGVDEQVERLGDQHDQRRRREREDPPRPGIGVGGAVLIPRRASASARRTRSRMAGASPSSVNPDATRCPPPPRADAAAATSMPPLERMLAVQRCSPTAEPTATSATVVAQDVDDALDLLLTPAVDVVALDQVLHQTEPAGLPDLEAGGRKHRREHREPGERWVSSRGA